MLDPITTLGDAGNIVQFVDFGLKCTSKAREIHSSATGALRGNVEIEILTRDISEVAKRLVVTRANNDELDDICGRCVDAADELLNALKKLKVDGARGKLKSVRAALNSIWGKEKVEEMKKRLEGYREEVQFHVVVHLRSQLEGLSTDQRERFDALDDHAKNIIERLNNNGGWTRDMIQVESVKSDARHLETMVTIIAKQDETHMGINETLEAMDANSKAEHEATRRELEQMKRAMAQIEQDMIKRDAELKDLLTKLRGVHNEKERKTLQEKSNAVTVALFALVIVYQSLQNIVYKIQKQTKVLVSSANLGHLWSLATLQKSPTVEAAFAEIPTFREPSLLEQDHYLEVYDQIWGTMFQGVTPTRLNINLLWSIDEPHRLKEMVDYQNAFVAMSLLNPSMKLSSGEVSRWTQMPPQSLGEGILPVKDDSETTEDNSRHESYNDEAILERKCTIARVASCIAISTIVSHCLGSASAASIIMRDTRRIRPSLSLRNTAEINRLVEEWLFIGEVTGLARKADEVLDLRKARWSDAFASDIPVLKLRSLPSINNVLIRQARSEVKTIEDEIRRFLVWLVNNDGSGSNDFLFQILTAGSPGTALYAMIEFLIWFGFRLTLSIELAPASDVRARVSRIDAAGIPGSLI